MKFHLGVCKKHIGTNCTTCTDIRTEDGEVAKKADIMAELERLADIQTLADNSLGVFRRVDLHVDEGRDCDEDGDDEVLDEVMTYEVIHHQWEGSDDGPFCSAPTFEEAVAEAIQKLRKEGKIK